MATVGSLSTLSADAVALQHLQDDEALDALLLADPKLADRMIKALRRAPAATQARVADSVRYLEDCVSNVTSAVAIEWAGSPHPATVHKLGDGDGDDRVRAFVGVYDMVRTWLERVSLGPANWSDLANGSASIWITRNDVQFVGSMEQMTHTVFNYMCNGVRAHRNNQPLDYNWLVVLKALLDPRPRRPPPRSRRSSRRSAIGPRRPREPPRLPDKCLPFQAEHVKAQNAPKRHVKYCFGVFRD